MTLERVLPFNREITSIAAGFGPDTASRGPSTETGDRSVKRQSSLPLLAAMPTNTFGTLMAWSRWPTPTYTPSTTEATYLASMVSVTNSRGVRQRTRPVVTSSAARPPEPPEHPAHCPYSTPLLTTIPENT